MRIRCDCGHEIVTHDTSALVAEARRHAADEHQMAISKERILALAEPYRDIEETPRERLAARNDPRTASDLGSTAHESDR